MSEDSSDGAAENTSVKVRQDDFRLATGVIDEERRLHLRAFDYWHRLKANKSYPLFTDLRPSELAPYKANSMLLEFKEKGVVVRFVGDEIVPLMEAPIKVGSYLHDFTHSIFARALVEQFAEESGRARAAEFEFEEEHIECRGMLLPFSGEGDSPNFIMVVANFRKRAAPIAPAADSVALPLNSLEEQLAESQQFAASVSHADSSSRTSLYQALSKALHLFESAVASEGGLEALLDNRGLKRQKRAPYTPVLKLVFGKKYDKTRLTEYAAALSCAVRAGHTSETLVTYLSEMPGGIKGCVQQERSFKRGSTGSTSHLKQQEAEEIVRQMPSKSLNTLNLEEEFSLLLVRRGDNGTISVIGEVAASEAALAAAIRKAAKY